jgi:hypothetical protein|tara:strand:+ start:1023 stop:1199 length:177 start_codon:yes stop_codon:yes gene_type:complete
MVKKKYLFWGFGLLAVYFLLGYLAKFKYFWSYFSLVALFALYFLMIKSIKREYGKRRS